MLDISAYGYRLIVEPQRGGSILLFEWRGKPVLRPVCGPEVTDTASFPLVPFSNRISRGVFAFAGRERTIPPNCPKADAVNPLHGYGWLAAWEVEEVGSQSIRISHEYDGESWPWRYLSEQQFSLSPAGLRIEMTLKNLSTEPMPAGLGFHPYFPCNAMTRYLSAHRGEWTNDATDIPTVLDLRDRAIDWWDGRAADTRVVNTVYSDRAGGIAIHWGDLRMGAVVTTSANLGHTVVYRPEDGDFICVEPVSHFTNALNRNEAHGAMETLDPGETMSCVMSIEVFRLPEF